MTRTRSTSSGRIWKLAGYAVATALDGKEALARLDEVRPAIVLLDVMMPGMDGWEVARMIKNHPDFSNVRVVMLTARSDFSDKHEGSARGRRRLPRQADPAGGSGHRASNAT